MIDRSSLDRFLWEYLPSLNLIWGGALQGTGFMMMAFGVDILIPIPLIIQGIIFIAMGSKQMEMKISVERGLACAMVMRKVDEMLGEEIVDLRGLKPEEEK